MRVLICVLKKSKVWTNFSGHVGQLRRDDRAYICVDNIIKICLGAVRASARRAE